MDPRITIKEEDENGSSDEDEFKFTEIHVKKPFYDWEMAESDHGLVFIAISSDGFDGFVREKFLNDLICVRRSYIMRDYTGLRFWIHKFKGSFKLFYSDFISKPCETMLSYIDHGRTSEMISLFSNFIVRMEIFIEKMVTLARETSNLIFNSDNPIKNDQLVEIRRLLDICDSYEDMDSRNCINNFRKEGTFKIEFVLDEINQINLSNEQITSSSFCSGCSIY